MPLVGFFLPVHHALLEGGGFAPVHVHGIGAQRPEGLNEDGAAHHPDLEPAHVLGLADGALAGGHFAKAVLGPADDFHALFLNGVNHHLAGFARHDGVHGLVAVRLHGQEEGQGREVQFLDLGGPVDGGSQGEVNGPVAQHQEFRGLLARQQLAGRIDLDVDAPLRAFAHKVGEIRGGHAPAGRGAGHHAQFVLGFVGGRRGRERRGQQTGAERQGAPEQTAFHQ